MNESQRLIEEICATEVLPKWRKTTIAEALGISRPTVYKLAHGEQASVRFETMDALRALHKKVTKSAR